MCMLVCWVNTEQQEYTGGSSLHTTNLPIIETPQAFAGDSRHQADNGLSHSESPIKPFQIGSKPHCKLYVVRTPSSIIVCVPNTVYRTLSLVPNTPRIPQPQPISNRLQFRVCDEVQTQPTSSVVLVRRDFRVDGSSGEGPALQWGTRSSGEGGGVLATQC